MSVITNGLMVANQLVSNDQVGVTILGGALRGINATITGPDAESMLNRVQATYAFIGTDAVDPVRGLTSRTYAQARLKAAMMGNAQRTYVVADSSKLGEHGLFHYWSELPDDWGLVTDRGGRPRRTGRAAGGRRRFHHPRPATDDSATGPRGLVRPAARGPAPLG